MPTKLTKMLEEVASELEHIPEGLRPQGALRALYSNKRMHSKGKKADIIQTPKEVLEECLTLLQEDYPGVEFKYDKQFFDQ